MSLYTCYSAIISMPVVYSISVYMSSAMSTTFHKDYCWFFAITSLVFVLAICYMLYAGCYMPSLICQFLYVEYHVLATVSLLSYQLICLSHYQFLHALCQISHASYSLPVFICRHMSAKYFLWVAKLAYMSISVAIYQTAISQSICQVLYFICYMPNIMCYMPNSVC
jgi:hypothetical protein